MVAILKQNWSSMYPRQVSELGGYSTNSGGAKGPVQSKVFKENSYLILEIKI